MHQRSDIFTVRNIFTLILLGVLIIGLYSYHNVNYRLSSSSTKVKALNMRIEASDNELRNAVKAKTACFKDVMQLRASTIDMKTKLSEAETELAKEKHEAASKLMRCAEEKKDLKSQLEKLQTEVQSLKEEDRNKVQKKKDEEEEKEKKLKEMTAEHELKVSKLKDEIADLQKEKEAVLKKLDAALQIVNKHEKTLGKETKTEAPVKKVEEDNSPRQMRPPVVKNPESKKFQSQSLKHKPIGLSKDGAAEGVLKMDEAKKPEVKKPFPDEAKKESEKKIEVKKEQPSALRKAQGGPGIDEEEKDSEKGNQGKEEKRGQQLDMPLPRDAAKQNKEPNQLPHPAAGADSADMKMGAARARQIQPANDDDDFMSRKMLNL